VRKATRAAGWIHAWTTDSLESPFLARSAVDVVLSRAADVKGE
jgi:hypothetical protein